VDVVSHLDEGLSLDVLDRESAVPDESTVVGLDDPQTVAVLEVVPLVPGDPGSCLLARLRRGVVTHDLGVTKQCSHVVEVVEVVACHLAKAQSGRRN